MTTTRKPLNRGRKPPTRFAPEVLDAFRNMQAVRCTCPPIDWVTPKAYARRPPPCAGCDEWWSNHHIVHRALRLPVHQWPAFERPDAANPYPAGSYAADQWRKRRTECPERFELFEALQAAADETA